ncbi:MAG: L,D-transpeptidase family protein [Candidatus Omnitrophica bacterium]|nr:L,D-transpeptidase family protein [Candidatus Omnitrophota bacterium]
MRRNIIIIVAVLIVVFALFQVIKIGKKNPEKVPVKSSKMEKIFAEAVKLKDEKSAAALAAFENIISEFPQSLQAEQSLLKISEIYDEADEKLQMKQTFKRLIDVYPNGEAAQTAKQKLGEININSIFSSDQTDNSFIYEIKSGDTLYKIAKQYNTNVELIMRSNNLASSLIKPSMKLKIIKSVFSIEVFKSQTKLLLKADGEIIKEYPVGVGENNSTPVGKFKVINRIVDPVWYKTGAVVPAGSAENILGTRWMGLSEPGYGIHGTTDTQPIQQQLTQGCIRMRNEDVEELFVIVPVGTEVVMND